MIIPKPNKYIKTVRNIMTNGFLSFDILNITRLSAAAFLFQLRYDKNAMKKNRNIFLSTFILCIFLTPFFTPVAAQASETYKIFTANRFDAYLDTKYFKSESNFDLSGAKQSLPVNSTLQNINLQTSARYLFFNDLALYSGINFNNIESNNGINSRTNSQLTHFFVGGDYQFFQSENWSLYTDISYFISNEKIDLNQDTAIASDGANDFKTLVVAVVDSESFKSFAKVGVDYRTVGLSALLLYGFGGEFFIGNSAIGAEFDGISSIKDDLKTDTPLVRDTLTNRVNAGSRIFYSINPNLLDGQFYFSYAFNTNLAVKFSAGSSVIGSNSADGNHAGFSINWGFSGNNSSSHLVRQPKKVINNSSLPDNEPGFKINTLDGVNQNLFKQVEPVKPKK